MVARLTAAVREPPVVERSNVAAALPDLPGLLRSEAIRTRPFLMVLLFVITSFGGVAIMTAHGPALFAERGLNIGPTYLGFVAFGSVIGQLVSGHLLDRIDSPRVGVFFALAALTGGMKILYFGTTVAVVLPAAFVLGPCQGAETGLAPYFVSRFCGLRAYTGISGLLMASAMLSAGSFAAFVGFVFDSTGGYTAAIPLTDLLLALAVIAILLLPGYRYAAVAPTVADELASLQPLTV